MGVTVMEQWTDDSRSHKANISLRVLTRGGHLGIIWVGMCRPGLQIGTPFYKNFP